MKARTIGAVLTLCFALTIAARPARAADDLLALLRAARADMPATLVVVDFEKFDKAIVSYVKAIDPTTEFQGMVGDVKRDLGIGDWIDFSKPVVMGQASLAGGEQWVIWATVPDFLEKVKGVPEATQEEGVWHFAFETRPQLFATVKGPYVIASSDRESLMKAAEGGASLADALKDRMDLLANRDALIHVNVDSFRPMALGGIAQAAQMVPMFAMMGGAQGGADPAALTAMVTAVIDMAKSFVEQLAYLDIAVGIEGEMASVTLATGYNEGGIKSYLAKQKPAGVPLLTEFEQQPYLVAMGWHVPGTESPFFDYLLDKMLAAIQTPPGGPQPGGPAGGPGQPPPPPGAPAGASSETLEAMKKGLEIGRELYRKVQGMNMLVSFSSEGMKTMGDYIGSDAPGILDLAKKSLLSANPMSRGFGGGFSYEPSGSRKVGEVMVEEYAVKVDAANPAAAQAAMMFGENSRIGFGLKGDRVRYFMGREQDAQGVFAGKVAEPLASNKLAAEAIAKLPAKRNAIILIDPAGVLPLLGQMMPGMPAVGEVPPGPPIAISASLCGEPAQVDIRVPARAIGRVIEAVSPDQPM